MLFQFRFFLNEYAICESYWPDLNHIAYTPTL